jgi:hypothetical protein
VTPWAQAYAAGMTESACQRCGRAIWHPGAERAAKLCSSCRTGNKYNAEHRRIRKANLSDAYGQPCFRCGKVMREGDELHLDHLD